MFLHFITLALLVKISLAALPGPLIYVVTPSSKSISKQDVGHYYFNNWRRNSLRPPEELITTTTRPTNEEIKTPDLIFADFDADNESHVNSMRKTLKQLLEREKVKTSTSTVATKSMTPWNHFSDFNLPSLKSPSVLMELPKEDKKTIEDVTKYPIYVGDPANDTHNMYEVTNDEEYRYNAINDTISATETTEPSPMKVEDVWHIINKEMANEETSKWETVPIEQNVENTESNNQNDTKINGEGDAIENDGFVYPGLNQPQENESRAIRTKSNNIRFPYVNLKPFVLKPNKNHYSNKNEMFVNLPDLEKEQHQLKGVVYDVHNRYKPTSGQVDRYNPAQPYLPIYGTAASKPDTPAPSPPKVKTVANLVPPPPPPSPPKATDTLPPPSSYESFPPFPPAKPSSSPGSYDFISSGFDSFPPYPPNDSKPPPLSKPVYQPPQMDDMEDTIPPPSSYEPFPPYSSDPTKEISKPTYKPPLKMIPYDSTFRPTLPPQMPSMKPDKPPETDMTYSYPPPPHKGVNSSPENDQPPSDAPISYHYHKPAFNEHHSHYGDHGDYPELIYSKPHGSDENPPPQSDDNKMPDTMMAPPAMDNGMPMPDAQFPSMTYDNPPYGDLDFKHHHYHDIEDDHHHYHHHHPTTTTTTTTTEMPRENRYSYYYLGKKLYYLPLYFSVYFVIYVISLIIKSFLRHKIVYPQSWRPVTTSRRGRSVTEEWDLTGEKMHEITRLVTRSILSAAEKYQNNK